jgi:hypothetical protein
MESEQRVIIQFLLNEGTKVDNIHKRLQAQFTHNTYSIQRVKR